VELILVDFVHGNPHRSQSNAIAMMLFLNPIIGAIIAIWTLVVFGPSQAFQAVAMPMLVRVCRIGPECGALLLLPAAAAVTWYCFDYLTPRDIGFPGSSDPEWEPWRHGITAGRYLGAFGAQSAVTVFTMLYIRTSSDARWRGRLILLLMLAAIAAGVIERWRMAFDQYKFL